MQLNLKTHLTSAHFGIAFLMGALMLSPLVLAGYIPEPTPDLPDMESIAYKAKAMPTIDGDLSDWKNAAFKFIGEENDVYRGNWTGPDDLSYIWSVMWDENTFYFAAAIWDDIYQESANASQPWTGDCLFLYIDADADSTIDNKPCFFLLDDQPTVFAASGGVQPENVELAIVMEPELGIAGRIIEVAIPLDSMANMSPAQGGEFNMMPGYEEGTQGAESGKFIDWDGLNPDDATNLRKVTFSGFIDNSGPITLAYRPSPTDGDMLEDNWANMSWRPGDWAVSHDVYLGDVFNDVSEATRDSDVYRGNQTAGFYIAGFPGFAYPEGLDPGTTYYWRIDEVNAPPDETVYKGDVWSFSLQPRTAYLPDPADGGEAVDVDVQLGWTAGFGAKLHTVYFGETFDEVDNAAGGLPQGILTYSPGTLKMAKTYYWRVDEFDSAETYKGVIWSFTTEGAVTALNPANGAVDITQTPVLTWAPGLGTSHEVYFGTDAGSLELKASGNLGEESYEPGQLEWDTTYYWRVDEAGNANTDSPWTGPLWSFTTANFLIIDDMESYNDLDEGEPGSNRIYLAWMDGFDNPAINGSTVGNLDPPFAEQNIVHTGNQSMPFAYDNGVGKSEATLTLTSNKDWTVNGVDTLTIWHRGGSSNAPETMYVVLNGSATVDNENPDAAKAFTWTEWNIPLQAFADQGVNLSNVSSITLGLRSVTGGSGMLYFDDIRLYPSEQ
ncbi:MAG: sugar-binding protein [Planctomycetota bacterium]